MKHTVLTITAAILTLFTANMGYAFLDDMSGVKIELQSWCEGDIVKTYDQDGIAYTYYDCYDANRRCVEDKATSNNDIVVITATCK